MRVLVVEDNRHLANSLKKGLENQGYAVDVVYDGEEGLKFSEVTAYDVLILDIMLPKKNGLDLCRELRRRKIAAPIILLTARGAVDDRVAGLDSGADDYLVKPFAQQELFARLRALLRRNTSQKSGLLEVADLMVDPATHFVQRGGQEIELTAKEYALLEFFMRHPNQMITREMIERHIWSYDFECTSNIIDVYVRRLRRKIDDLSNVKLLETVRGAGYRLRVPVQK